MAFFATKKMGTAGQLSSFLDLMEAWDAIFVLLSLSFSFLLWSRTSRLARSQGMVTSNERDGIRGSKKI